MSVNQQIHFSHEDRKKNGGIPVRSSNSVFGCSGKYLEWFSVSLLKDNVLMSKNGLSMEDISHA